MGPLTHGGVGGQSFIQFIERMNMKKVFALMTAVSLWLGAVTPLMAHVDEPSSNEQSYLSVATQQVIADLAAKLTVLFLAHRGANHMRGPEAITTKKNALVAAEILVGLEILGYGTGYLARTSGVIGQAVFSFVTTAGVTIALSGLVRTDLADQKKSAILAAKALLVGACTLVTGPLAGLFGIIASSNDARSSATIVRGSTPAAWDGATHRS